MLLKVTRVQCTVPQGGEGCASAYLAGARAAMGGGGVAVATMCFGL